MLFWAIGGSKLSYGGIIVPDFFVQLNMPAPNVDEIQRASQPRNLIAAQIAIHTPWWLFEYPECVTEMQDLSNGTEGENEWFWFLVILWNESVT